MKIEILYQTLYTYEEPVSFSPHLYRLFPKPDRFVHVREIEFQTNADAVVTYRRDLFDNEVASCFYPEHCSMLGANLRVRLDVMEKNAFGFLLAPHALDFPFQYDAHEQRVLEPYLAYADAPELGFWRTPAKPIPTIEALVALNFSLFENLQYERREEGAARSPSETLACGGGACRDFALLLAETLRANGVAARFASGYLCEFGTEDRRAEGALHAWTEAYLPGAGWVGFDPTNGVLCNHNHIAAAVGLAPQDVSPVSGRYFHNRAISAQMAASLQIHEVS